MADGKPQSGDKKRKERGVDFRTFFNLPKDKLVDDFSCAFQGGTTFIQGRLYVSDKHVCFGSIFSEKQVMVSYSSVISINKKTTAYVFPNAIEVVTKKMTFFFTSLIYRDSAFDALNASWQAFIDQDKGSGTEETNSGSASDSEYSSEGHSTSGEEETDTGTVSGSEVESIEPALTQPELDRVKAALGGTIKKEYFGPIPEVNKANQTLPTSEDQDVLFQSLLQMSLDDFWRTCWANSGFYEKLAATLELKDFKIQKRWQTTEDSTQYRKCEWTESEETIVQTQLCRRLVPDCLEVVLHSKYPEKGIFQRWEIIVEDMGLRFSASLWCEGSTTDQLDDGEKTIAMDQTTNFLLLLHTMHNQSPLPDNVSPRKVALPIPVTLPKSRPHSTPDSQKRNPEATPAPTPEKGKGEQQSPATPTKTGSPTQSVPPSPVASPGSSSPETSHNAIETNETQTTPTETPNPEITENPQEIEQGVAKESAEPNTPPENNEQNNPALAQEAASTVEQKEVPTEGNAEPQPIPELNLSGGVPKEEGSPQASAPIPIGGSSSKPSSKPTSPRVPNRSPTPPGVGGSPDASPLNQRNPTPPRIPLESIPDASTSPTRISSSRPRYPSPPKPVPATLQDPKSKSSPLPTHPESQTGSETENLTESDGSGSLGKLNPKRRQSRTESTTVKEDASPLLQDTAPRSPLDRLSAITDNIMKFYSPTLLLVILVVISVVFLNAWGRLQTLEAAVQIQMEGTKVDTRLIERVMFLQYMANLLYNANQMSGLTPSGFGIESHYLGAHKEDLQHQLEDWKGKSSKILSELKNELKVEWLSNFVEIQREASEKASTMKLPPDINTYSMSEYSWFYLLLGLLALLPAFVLIYMSFSAEPTRTTVVRRHSDVFADGSAPTTPADSGRREILIRALS